MSDPYRSPPTEARYVCLCCFRSLSIREGSCLHCGIPRVDLSDPEVRDAVRAEVERRLDRSLIREQTQMYFLGAAAVPLVWVASFPFGIVVIDLMTCLTVAGLIAIEAIYAHLRRRSATAILAARRQRISAELGVDIRSHTACPMNVTSFRSLVDSPSFPTASSRQSEWSTRSFSVYPRCLRGWARGSRAE